MKKQIGQQLREYRERCGLGQGEAELTLDLSTGSLSRFENNKVNPSKETLIKLVDLYDLNAIEAAEIFGINIIDSYSNIIEYTKKLVESSELDKKIQLLVDSFCNELNLLCITVCLIDEDEKGKYIFPYVLRNAWYTKLVLKVFNKSIHQLKYYFSDGPARDTYTVKTLKTSEVIESRRVENFISPPIEFRKAKICIKLTNNKTTISYPMTLKNKNFGVVLFSSNQDIDWEDRKKVLHSITDLFTTLIAKDYDIKYL